MCGGLIRFLANLLRGALPTDCVGCRRGLVWRGDGVLCRRCAAIPLRSPGVNLAMSEIRYRELYGQSMPSYPISSGTCGRTDWKETNADTRRAH